MGYFDRSGNRRRGLPLGMLAIVLGLVFWGMAAPSKSYAVSIICGSCHSNPPQDSDSGGCKLTEKNHPAHSSGSDLTTCERCHPATGSVHPVGEHNNNFVDITSIVAPGLSYDGSTCTNACHKNQDTVWGATLDCNVCHFRKGAVGNYPMSGLHVTADKSWKHYSSAVRVNGQKISCDDCHPNNDDDAATPKSHISSTNFAKRADMSEAHTYVSVTGIGYIKGATPEDGMCANSCHYNPTDPFGNYTIYFKPGQKMRFGPYQTAKWGEVDLKCNECHSTPGQQATFGGSSSVNANKRHEAHMFRYKLNPYNFMNEDRGIYCDDCHRTPDIYATRGFLHHSTAGAGGSGVISLPVKSRNSKVYLLWRNNGKGRDGLTEPTYNSGTTTCNNIYCHTIMTTGSWTEEACDSCHGQNNGVDVGSGAPGYENFTTPNYSTFQDYSGGGGAHYSHVMKRGYPCRTCHFDGGGDGDPDNHHANQIVPVGDRVVDQANVNVGVQPQYWFNNKTSFYNLETRACSNVRCHYGASQNWDCEPLH